jgi:hypothetical protein
MATSGLDRIPVVAGTAYIERVRRLPSTLTVALAVELDNPYFRHAIAVQVGGEKVGYVAPELARRYFEPLKSHPSSVACAARRASHTDHETSGVELLLDFSSLPVQPVE